MSNDEAEPVDAAEGGQVRASTLELFFDLVFVFTITQLAQVFGLHSGWPAFGRVVLMFGVIWWMYSGYVFLTNEVAPSSSARRSWLLVGMFGFFVIALAIPEAFTGSGLAFGLGYFVVNLVHTGLFYANGGRGATSAILRIAPVNAAIAVLVLIGGISDGWPRYLLWALAFALQLVAPYLVNVAGFRIRPSHFAERHGLVIIIAVGESVVAIGAGLAGEPITVGLVAMVALGLSLAYVMWWSYFGLDDEAGEAALGATPVPRRARRAAVAYGYALYPLLIGVILTSAGLRLSIAHGNLPVGWPAALALSGGVALYFAGQAAFRTALGLHRPWSRVLAALAALATAPIGIAWVAWGQLGVLVAVAFAAVIADDIAALRAGAVSAYASPASMVIRITLRDN
ncbi:low temperature requirement protein A [Nocardia sp. NEAU-G5]|uniref:Low temperature requirement protein A n=1 Tax=Nocardia albiluteola TaxID=2842303 RepID=A0ABS6B9K0_9NOCA|nr:low temperature requirement protein A [Nocardia albiluteola]MBU3066978.1 low temperature requirement protein A [Nocardia albiluteola]